MVRGQYLSSTGILELSRTKLDDLLVETFDIHQSELDDLRTIFPYSDRIIDATKLLYDVTDDALALTQTTLAAIVSPTWNKSCRSNFAAQIKKMFKETKKMREEAFGVKLTNMHILRDSIGAYDGNLEEAREVWPNFIVSSSDLLRSVRLPLEIDYDYSQLLGIIWGDGSAQPRSIVFSGTKNDFPMYDILAERLGVAHNLNFSDFIYITDRTTDFGSTEEYSFSYPSLNLNSKAVTTWIIDDLGFPNNEGKKNVNLPTVEFDKKGFFEGIIASMGSLNKKYEMRLQDHDERFIDEISSLAKELGYTPVKHKIKPRLIEGRYYGLAFSPNEVKDMNLIHPKHN